MGEAFRPRRFSELDGKDLAATIMQFAPQSDAEALKLLRARFPDSPLSLRVAALDYLMRRRPRGLGRAYSPR
ncbi:MAG TPA: hypothetical protein VG986_18280 [Pseudolabrys sp.]|nr:hypothetical protein [Pseudolabrys sp.]